MARGFYADPAAGAAMQMPTRLARQGQAAQASRQLGAVPKGPAVIQAPRTPSNQQRRGTVAPRKAKGNGAFAASVKRTRTPADRIKPRSTPRGTGAAGASVKSSRTPWDRSRPQLSNPPGQRAAQPAPMAGSGRAQITNRADRVKAFEKKYGRTAF